jgi:predicted phage-related endonuclease
MRERKSYIGSTDCAPIIGVCKYRNALDVFMSKTGITQNREPTEAMKAGLELEDYVLGRAEKELKIKIITKQRFTSHLLHDFLGGTLDAIATEENGESVLIEAKTSRFGKDFERDSIPDPYMLQVQYLMGLNGLKKAYVCVLIGGQQFKTYTVFFDESLYNKIIRICVKFWEDHILKGIPPVVERKIDKQLPDNVLDAYNRIRKLQEEIKAKQDELDKLKEQFDILTPGLNEVTNNGVLLAKKTESVRETLDRKELEKVYDVSKFLKKTNFVTLRFY